MESPREFWLWSLNLFNLLHQIHKNYLRLCSFSCTYYEFEESEEKNVRFYCWWKFSFLCCSLFIHWKFTCVSEVTSSCMIFVRPDDSSFNKSASEQPVRFVNPAKIVNPSSSRRRAKHHANGDSHPVIKIAFPLAETCWDKNYTKEKKRIAMNAWKSNESKYRFQTHKNNI